MTATVDLVSDFRRRLPPAVSRQLHDTQRLIALVGQAVDRQQWSVKQLADECGRDLGQTSNAAAVVMWRLEKAAAHPPPNKTTATRTQLNPLCGRCEDGWLVDPKTRLPIARCTCRQANTTTGRTAP